MIIVNHEQGTPEWYKSRCGIPTASCFDQIITSKGERSKSRQKYLYKLAGECLTGVPEETYKNGAMQRGIGMEAEARRMYELVTGETVEQVGLCVVDSGAYGASPDGLVGKDGAVEIKCPNLATHVGYLLGKELPTDYFQQVQGGLAVTKRRWTDFVSYYPGIKPFIFRVKPNTKFILALEIELAEFFKDLTEIVTKLRGED